MAESVDILILSWNRVDDTIAAIASAHEQTGINQSIYVVDQGSSQENLARLREVIRTIPEAHLEELGKNVGVASGRNRAAALGNSPYLVALDSDAVFADHRSTRRAIEYLSERPDLCAVGFRITNFFTKKNDLTSWDYPDSQSPDTGFRTTRFIGAGHAIRRSSFQEVGGYDGRLFFCGEELDLCYRMLNAGGRIEYYPAAEILHKISPEHRVQWGKGRYFYTVRNALYSSYKFGFPKYQLAVSALAFITRGLVNGMPLTPLRASIAAVRLARQFDRSSDDRRFYKLTDEVKRYIVDCEPDRSESIAKKIIRQFQRLPNQKPS